MDRGVTSRRLRQPPPSRGGRHTELTVEEACPQVRQVHLAVEVRSSYFIFRPLCVAK